MAESDGAEVEPAWRVTLEHDDGMAVHVERDTDEFSDAMTDADVEPRRRR